MAEWMTDFTPYMANNLYADVRQTQFMLWRKLREAFPAA